MVKIEAGLDLNIFKKGKTWDVSLGLQSEVQKSVYDSSRLYVFVVRKLHVRVIKNGSEPNQPQVFENIYMLLDQIERRSGALELYSYVESLLCHSLKSILFEGLEERGGHREKFIVGLQVQNDFIVFVGDPNRNMFFLNRVVKNLGYRSETFFGVKELLQGLSYVFGLSLLGFESELDGERLRVTLLLWLLTWSVGLRLGTDFLILTSILTSKSILRPP